MIGSPKIRIFSFDLFLIFSFKQLIISFFIILINFFKSSLGILISLLSIELDDLSFDLVKIIFPPFFSISFFLFLYSQLNLLKNLNNHYP